MNGINNPELIKRLNDRVPQTFDELMKRTRSFIQGEAAAADSRKGYSNNRSQEQSRRQSNDQSSSRNNSYRGQRGGRGNDKYTPLTMTPKRILANGKVRLPKSTTNAHSGRATPKADLRSPGEEHSGRKEFKDGGKKDALETRLAPIFMVAVMSSGKLSKMVKPLTIGDKCSGSRYHRMYIDGEHHADILSKHCFQRLRPEVKFMVGNKEHFYNSLMNFMVNQYPIAIQWHYWKTRDLSDTRGPIHGPWDAKVHPLQRRKLSPLQHRAPLKKCNSVTCDMTQETAATNDTPSKAENRASSERAKGHSGGGTLNNCGEYHARSLLPRLVIQPVMVKKKRMVAGDVHWDFTTLNNAMSQTVSTTGDRLEVGVLLRIPSKCFLDAYKGYPQIPIGQDPCVLVILKGSFDPVSPFIRQTAELRITKLRPGNLNIEVFEKLGSLEVLDRPRKFNKNEGNHYVPVKKNGVPGPTNANDYDGSGKGKSKVDEGRSSRDSFAVNGMASEKMNIDERVINKKKNGENGGVENMNVSCESNKDNAMKGVGSQNMFSALSDEVEIEKRLEWESMKERVDEACEKGLHISIEEKINWSEDLWDYFKISHSSRMIAKESKTKTKAMVKSVMIEKGLTKNQATRKVYEEVYSDEEDRIKEMIMKKQLAEVELFSRLGKLEMGNSEDMNDELVAWNVKGMCNTLKQNEVKTFIHDNNISLCGIIETQLRKKFMTKDPLVVSTKLLAQTDQAMHLLVKSLLDDNQMYISVIYGENTPKSRARLWKNLIDHMSIAGWYVTDINKKDKNQAKTDKTEHGMERA
ncbi:hypothetical protein Tco_0088673 [Tanacetum coccineum]